jgi:hypothetical protein
MPDVTPGRLGDLGTAILRVLAGTGPAGLSPALLLPLANPDLTVPYQRNSLNRALGALRSHGLVERTGEWRTGHRASGYRWHITDTGRAHLYRLDHPPADERAVRRRRAEAALGRFTLAGYGPDTALPDKRAAAAVLKDAGCTYQQIADLFDVSRQTVHQNWGGTKPGRAARRDTVAARKAS